MSLKSILVIVALIVFVLLLNLFLTRPRNSDKRFHIITKRHNKSYDNYTFGKAYLSNLIDILIYGLIGL